MNNQYLTYFPKDFLEKFSWIKIRCTESTKLYDRGSTKSDFKIITIMKLLNVLCEEEKVCFTKLYFRSQIRMKVSFMNYLHFVLDRNFVVKNKVIGGPGYVVEYSITEKGKMFLEVLT